MLTPVVHRARAGFLRSPASFGVGELLFTPDFELGPAQVAGWRARAVLEGRDDRPSFRPSLEGPPEREAIPRPLLLARTIEAVAASVAARGCHLRATSTPRVLGARPVAVGARLRAVATVRHRSARPGPFGRQRWFLTLHVELRGPGGQRLVALEVGAEVFADEATGPRRAAA